jgi:hypothetical protein
MMLFISTLRPKPGVKVQTNLLKKKRALAETLTRGISHRLYDTVIKIGPSMHLTVTGSSTWRLLFNFRIVHVGFMGHYIFTANCHFFCGPYCHHHHQQQQLVEQTYQRPLCKGIQSHFAHHFIKVIDGSSLFDLFCLNLLFLNCCG